jgi:TRAP transporter TAXI family solute receptor
MIKKFLFIATLSYFCANAEDNKLITISSGPTDGQYYKLSNAICELINNTNQDGYICKNSATRNNEDSVEILASNDTDFAFAEGDVISKYINRSEKYNNIRGVIGLTNQAFNAAVNLHAEVNTIRELKDIYLSSGMDNSHVDNMLDILKQNVSFEYDLQTIKVKQDALPQAICTENVAYFKISAHPNDIIKNIAQKCKIKFLNLSSDEINSFAANEYYYKYTINKSIYDTDEDVNILATRGIIITRLDVDSKKVKILVNAIISNISTLQEEFKFLEDFKTKDSFTKGFIIRPHPSINVM